MVYAYQGRKKNDCGEFKGLFLFVTVVFISLILSTIPGCNKKPTLSRDQAKKSLLTIFQNQVPDISEGYTVGLQTGRVMTSKDTSSPFINTYLALQKSEFIVCEDKGSRNYGNDPNYFKVYSCELTNKGKPFLAGEAASNTEGMRWSNMWIVRADKVEILGIADKTDSERIVEYSVSYIPTPIGEITRTSGYGQQLATGIRTGQALFRFYDTGWKVVSASTL